MNREPLLTKASWVSLVTAVIAVAVAFGLPLSDEQQKALIALAGVLAPVAAAVWARGQVTPVADPRDDDGQPLTPADDY